jgi:bifunctional UDP-N-acetylglucosamine pyrophosphorylase / glucosamine-1-phosphate N-acetyltransferase
MQPDVNGENWREFAAPQVDASLWTAIVPAAGRGSRMGLDRPKILYPVAGRMILERLLERFLPHCSSVIFVLSPEGRTHVECELERLAAGRYSVVVQETPTGMGDAVEVGLRPVSTELVAVIWGDQVAVRPSSVEACLRLHQGPLQPDITCPTVMRPNPYIHFDRDAQERLRGVRQAREGDPMPTQGESDTGLFCFRACVLRDLLTRARANAKTRGRNTGEFNLLPVIPAAAVTGYSVLTPRLMTVEETVGVNSMDDVAIVEQFLRSSHACR